MPRTDVRPGRFLVLGDPLVLRPSRLADRVRARALGASLDRQLAAGRPPESSRPLAARAESLVSLPRRASVARDWERVLRVARRSPAAGHPAAPLCAGRILDAEPAIRTLIDCLTAPLPVTARGVALASLPLTDGTGPVYNRRSAASLADVLAAAIAHLDPARPLMPAA
jgi:hypothetical protein